MERAIKLLAKLRVHFDGCGPTADQDDWIDDCDTQERIRTLLDLLAAKLEA